MTPHTAGNRMRKGLVSFTALALFATGCSSTAGADSTSVPVANAPAIAPTTVATVVPTTIPKQGWESVIGWRIVDYKVIRKDDCNYSAGYMKLTIEVTNNSGKRIVSMGSEAAISDLFGERLLTLDLPSDDPIGVGETALVGSTGGSCFPLNQFIDEEVRLMSMTDPMTTSKVVFSVQRIAFANGEIALFS